MLSWFFHIPSSKSDDELSSQLLSTSVSLDSSSESKEEASVSESDTSSTKIELEVLLDSELEPSSLSKSLAASGFAAALISELVGWSLVSI